MNTHLPSSKSVSSSPKRPRLFGIVNSVHDQGFAFLAPLVAGSEGFIFLHHTELKQGVWKTLQPGCWIEFDLFNGPRGWSAKGAAIVTPSLEERQQRLLIAYSETHGMSGGANPRSQRLDGLTGTQAKRLCDRGYMTVDQFYGWMSENGLQAVAGSYGIQYIPGEREAVIRGILALIEEKSGRMGMRE